MKATLVYNHSARQGQSLTPDDILEVLLDAGFHPVYKATEHTDDLDSILDGIEGLVVTAGGDGTAKAVAMRLIGNENAAMTILPMGTANNLAATLGIEGAPLEIVKRLEQPEKHRFDLGRVVAPWGEDYFMEGAGFGFFAEALAKYDPEKGKSITRSVQTLVEVLRDGYGQRTTIRLPQEEISTEFLLVEILNARAVGPRLEFAPDADPTDGLLHVVCIDGEKGESFFRYLRSLMIEGDIATLPSVDVYRVPNLEITWNGFPFHVDEYIRPLGFDFRQKDDETLPLRLYPDVPQEATIRVEVIPQALNLWLPQRENGEKYDHEN